MGFPLINHPAIGYPHDYGNPHVSQGDHCVLQSWQYPFGHRLWGLLWASLGCAAGMIGAACGWAFTAASGFELVSAGLSRSQPLGGEWKMCCHALGPWGLELSFQAPMGSSPMLMQSHVRIHSNLSWGIVFCRSMLSCSWVTIVILEIEQ